MQFRMCTELIARKQKLHLNLTLNPPSPPPIRLWLLSLSASRTCLKMVTFIQPPSLGTSSAPAAGHSHSHDGVHSHSHDHDHGGSGARPAVVDTTGMTERERKIAEHGHSHEGMEFVGASLAAVPKSRERAVGLPSATLRPRCCTCDTGKFAERDLPDFSGRNWAERAFTIGIGG